MFISVDRPRQRQGTPLLLLVAGGGVYSLGAALQAHGRVLFHNAVWHAMVALAAGLHLGANILLLPIASGAQGNPAYQL